MDIDFAKLIRLQEIDSELHQTSLYLDNLPRLIEEIDRKVQADTLAVADAKDKLTRNQKRRRDLESQVKDLKVTITRYKRQLNEVKTNREYTGLLKEIEDTQRQVDGFEEQIITEMLAADDVEEEIKAALVKQSQEADILRKDKEVLLQKKREMDDRRARLDAERAELLPQIPAEQQRLYQAIAGKKSGVAMSPVRGDFCAMCHMRIRPQMLNEIRDGTKVIACENCGRILYWPPAKPESKVESKVESKTE